MHTRLSIEPGIALLALAATLAGCVSTSDLPTESLVKANNQATTIRQCAGLAVAGGWIWVNSETNTLATCGDYPGNVAVLRDVRHVPLGTSMEACAGTPIPRGWRVVEHHTRPGRCEDSPDNVAVIQYDSAGKDTQ